MNYGIGTYVSIFKTYVTIAAVFSINFSIAYAFSDFSSPHIDDYAEKMISSGEIFSLIKGADTSINITPDKDYGNIFFSGSTEDLGGKFLKEFNKETGIGFIKSVTVRIPTIGILQPTYVMKIGDLKDATTHKSDKDIIDLELNDLYDLDKGFLLGGHSSGYFWDKSDKKNVFKDLEKLKDGDRVYFEIVGTLGKKIETYEVYGRTIGKDIKVSKSDKIAYTCYPTNTSKERLVLFLKTIKDGK